MSLRSKSVGASKILYELDRQVMHLAPVELITKSVEAGLVYRTDLFFETAI